MHDADLAAEHVYRQARADEWLWQQARALGVSRRRLLRLLASGAGATLLGAVPRRAAQSTSPASPSGDDPFAGWFVKPTPPEYFVDHGRGKEMRWDAVSHREYLTPIARFYVNNHYPTPRTDPATYRLRVDGSGVSRPLELTYDDLLALPSRTITSTQECGQNGHVLFEEQFGRLFPGTRWRLGAIGVAEFTGVPFGEVLERARMKPTTRDVMPIGVDGREDDPERPARPMPLAKALAENTLLVYGMNGEPLPPDHGFPIRAFLPGWVATASIKWVGHIVVSEEPLTAHFELEHSLLVGPDYPPERGLPGQLASDQSIKSAFELAWPATLPAGRQTITG